MSKQKMTVTKFRSPGALPYFLAVTQDGSIRRLPYGDGISGLVEKYNGKPVLTRAAEARGYTPLEKLYAEDSRPQVRQAGFQTYLQWNEAARLGRAEKTKAGMRGDAPRMATKQLPDKWLPEEVIRRRNGESAVSVAAWTPPELPDEVTAEIEIEAEPDPERPKRGKAKAAKA